MAFVFDSTAKSATANSYVSVSEADDYFAAHLDSNFWPTASKDKQAALVMATNRIDAETFQGRRTELTQSLQWPRSWVVARGSAFVDSDIIPRELKIATFEMALHYLKMKAGEFTVDENDLETLDKYKVALWMSRSKPTSRLTVFQPKSNSCSRPSVLKHGQETANWPSLAK